MHTYAERIAPDTVRLERLLPGPIERAWAFLTEADKRARWLAGGEWELRVGGRVQLEFAHDRLQSEPTPAKYRDMPMSFSGQVLRIDPPRLIEFTWMESEGVTTVVTFELAERGSQVALTITHRGIHGRDELLDISGGWDVHVGILEDVLADRRPRGFWSTHDRVTAEYARRFVGVKP
jgi:uncharacterized protein YndB with AHSA1/START domain